MTQAPPPHLLLTRPKEASERLAATIRERLGIKALISPVLEISPFDVAVDFSGVDSLVVTSANGARLMADLGAPQNARVFAVGDRTALEAQARGFAVQSAAGDADDLVAMILAHPNPGKVLHLRGEHSRGKVAERLKDAGISCEECVVYQQIAQELTAEALIVLAGEGHVVLPLFSPRSAALVGEAAVLGPNVWPVAMSAAVADAFGARGGRAISVTIEPTGAAMIEEITQLPPVRAWVEGRGMQV